MAIIPSCFRNPFTVLTEFQTMSLREQVSWLFDTAKRPILTEIDPRLRRTWANSLPMYLNRIMSFHLLPQGCYSDVKARTLPTSI